MTLDEYQKDCLRTAGPYASNPALAALGLVTEMAEYHDNPSVDEAGDVLWHVVVLGALTLEEVKAAWEMPCGFPLDTWVHSMDAVKKAIAKQDPLPKQPIRDAVRRIAVDKGLSEVMEFNVNKRAARYPKRKS